MRKTIATIFLLLIVETLFAIPAKDNQWRTITLQDGKTVRAKLVGDEFLHYYIDESGNKYIGNGTYFTLLNPSTERRLATRAYDRARQRMKRLRGNRRAPAYEGKKKGVILLVNFKDVKFKEAHTRETFDKLVNEENYQKGAIKGSVHDYFMAQSNGRFDLSFDVKGTYELGHERAYYGGNANIDGEDADRRPGEMVAEACRLAAGDVNYKDYDWDGDGEVDQVYVLYPGKGEADGGEQETIWPHEWNLQSSDYGRRLAIGDVFINTYACGPELDGRDKLCGIGTICHEFSHCLGLPDFYDTSNTGVSDMGSWSVMSNGCFGGGGHTPSGYTAYEKWLCGWQAPIVLQGDTIIENQQPISQNGETYILYNDAHKDEFYLLENRQQQGWDADLPDRGLMVTHVDYDETAWIYNQVNTESGHPRCTLITANGREPSYSFKSTGRDTHNLFPYGDKNSLTRETVPAAKLYNNNTDGTRFMLSNITQIVQQADGNISFRVSTNQTKPLEENDTLFYESFKDCNGTGGNDGKFSGRIASSKIYTDHSGWTYNHGGAGKGCMKLGTSTVAGHLISPAIAFDGDYVLSVKLAVWKKDGNTLDIRLDDQPIHTAKDVSSDHFTTYTIPFTAHGTHKLAFYGSKRFFIDDVLVMKKKSPTPVPRIGMERNKPASTTKIYNLQGQYVGTSLDLLPTGIYIRNGHKIRK